MSITAQKSSYQFKQMHTGLQLKIDILLESWQPEGVGIIQYQGLLKLILTHTIAWYELVQEWISQYRTAYAMIYSEVPLAAT